MPCIILVFSVGDRGLIQRSLQAGCAVWRGLQPLGAGTVRDIPARIDAMHSTLVSNRAAVWMLQ
jgi:hypothetical protein